MVLFLQLIVLVFTALVWWLARRDLTLHASQIRAGEMQELERLRVGVERLVADLERRAEAAEARLTARITEAQVSSVAPPPPSTEAPSDDRYAPALTLAAAGVTDPAEIARRTGLGRGEIELVLSLRARRASQQGDTH